MRVSTFRPHETLNRRTLLLSAGAVTAVALVMGWPTLRGTFVGGDDHRLVLNHVLVNHPSWEHAMELFRIVHRDLYQPLPLLSFSAEFAVAGWFDFFAEGVDAGAWFFHLTNVWMHALNAVLVWALMRRLNDGPDGAKANALAVGVALLFAVHPLQVEVVAWINGRMMLMSTLFALAALLALSAWLDKRRIGWGVAACFFVLCCAISKIRVGLPVLMLLVPLARHRRFSRGFWIIWAVSVAITAVFLVVNYDATAEAGMFSGAAEHLRGSKVVRGLLSLAWYFTHFVWPSGLASWYPAPGFVQWTDRGTLVALAIVLPVFVVAAWAAVRQRRATLGFVWFLATIASTLQVVPTRNTLAADRYMYLPIIGLLWMAVVFVSTGWSRWIGSRSPAPTAGTRRSIRRFAGPAALAAVVAALMPVSWHVASFYDNQYVKSERIATLFPEAPHVWERVAWAYYNAERYDDAIAAAQRELRHDDPEVQSEAWQAIGAAQARLARFDDALASLRRSMELNPQSASSIYRYAMTLEEAGRGDEALEHFERAVAMAPLKNPWLLRLAAMYRERGRAEDARRLYQQALENNPYEVPATLGLAELDLERATREGYLSAYERLRQLLDWAPENHTARINLGVVCTALGRTAEAVAAYEAVLRRDPHDGLASLNLGQLMHQAGDLARAHTLYSQALATGLPSIEQALVVHDFLVDVGDVHKAMTLWLDMSRQIPESRVARAMLQLTSAMDQIERDPGDLLVIEPAPEGALPIELAAAAYAALEEKRYAALRELVENLCAAGTSGSAARGRLLPALEWYDQHNPGVAWTYCATARLLLAESRADAAEVFLNLCRESCADEACVAYEGELRAKRVSTPR